ncbi:hypothetical protein AZI86_12830 [Bdellovibrio bacteriovorus]|uniref:Uncharacterized protein n=1 Tax=Bdellovibrio bacteriovorus TaxID=959 RepID=A0A150WIW3_BDEBC|nr:hypothetical protein [Bdellovibrio bacteriovorus]KYG63708.1 hypothetical protein AZI86_12830 [Bdellovibrio bacteriovorus]
MSDNKASDVQFYVIQNGSYISKEARELRAKIYDIWNPLWTDIYKEHGSSTLPSLAGFRSFEVLHCITVDGEVAGFSAHRFMDFRDALSKHLEYLQIVGEENLYKLHEMGIQKIMTFEALMIPPTQRKSISPIPISKLLFYLANRSFSLSPADGMVGAARVEVKVPLLSQALGYDLLESARVMRGIPCDVVVQRNREVFHPQEKAWHLSQELWEKRVLFRSEDPFTVARTEQTKKAA